VAEGGSFNGGQPGKHFYRANESSSAFRFQKRGLTEDPSPFTGVLKGRSSLVVGMQQKYVNGLN
jgi:hypothetical protein